MTLEYYRKGLEMLRAKLLKLEPESAAEGMLVIVMTETENLPWCEKTMKFGEAEGVRKTICAIPEGSRCKGEIIDMLSTILRAVTYFSPLNLLIPSSAFRALSLSSDAAIPPDDVRSNGFGRLFNHRQLEFFVVVSVLYPLQTRAGWVVGSGRHDGEA